MTCPSIAYASFLSDPGVSLSISKGDCVFHLALCDRKLFHRIYCCLVPIKVTHEKQSYYSLRYTVQHWLINRCCNSRSADVEKFIMPCSMLNIEIVLWDKNSAWCTDSREQTVPICPRGGWGTPLYRLYRYVRPQRIWCFSCFGLK